MQVLPTIQLPTINTGAFSFGPNTRTNALTFGDFIKLVFPKFNPNQPYLQKLISNLQQVADGELTRLLVFMPPRHGKSETISRMFSAYYLYRHPDRWVGLNSYAAELAYTLSRNARDNYIRVGGSMKGDAAAVKHWETGKGGGMWAAGVGGPITGKGFHLGIIDDPVKNAEEAQSDTVQRKHWDWYTSTFYTRAEPGNAIIVIQTRWNENDLSGQIIEDELHEPENWHILHFEAIKEDDPTEYPETCTVEDDERKAGDALNPDRYTTDKLHKLSRRLGDYFWGALFQQRPKPREGGMFKREYFSIVDSVPKGAQYVRYWDKAGTKDAGDYTAGLLMAKHGNDIYIVDYIDGQWEAPEREQIIRQTAATDRATYGYITTGHEQEPGSGGKESAQHTARVTLAGFASFADKVTGDKVSRAEPMASHARDSGIKMVQSEWNRRLIDMFCRFPAKPRDGVDAGSGAFNRIAATAGNATIGNNLL